MNKINKIIDSTANFILEAMIFVIAVQGLAIVNIALFKALTKFIGG